MANLPGCTCTSLLRGALRNAPLRAFVRHSSVFQWRRAVPEGQLPAYDEALKYIAQDQKQKLARVESLRAAAKKSNSLHGEEVANEAEALACINDPETRALFAHGLADYSKPVFRKLYDQQWRLQGELAHLMLQVHQSAIIPDLVSDIDPVVDLILKSDNGKYITTASTVPTEATLKPVQVTARIPHGWKGHFYTLALIDLDVPNLETSSYNTYCHQLLVNIPLTAAEPVVQGGQSLLDYIPPHPQQGSSSHRYVYVLLTRRTDSAPIKVETAVDRHGFNLRDFAEQHGLEAQGINFFRQEWSPATSAVYQELGLHEPRYGRMPRLNLNKALNSSTPYKVAGRRR